MKDLFDLLGRVVPVTGAARGLGRAIAEGCGFHGAALVLVDRDKGALADTTRALSQDGRAAVLDVRTDVANSVQLRQLAEQAWDSRCRIDTLVCKACVQGPAGPLPAGLMSDTDFMARRLQATPLRRVGEPYEIAGLAVLLARVHHRTDSGGRWRHADFRWVLNGCETMIRSARHGTTSIAFGAFPATPN